LTDGEKASTRGCRDASCRQQTRKDSGTHGIDSWTRPQRAIAVPRISAHPPL